jgi:hypothetical protein
MNFKRLLNTELGKVFISVMIGLGLATLFRKVCKDKNCISFNGPVISEVDGKIYRYGEKCYKYSSSATSCDANKKIVDMGSGQGTHGSPNPSLQGT